MKTKTWLGTLAFALLALAGVACDSSGSDGNCEIGSVGCNCTAGGACNPGLTCFSNICVKDDSDVSPTDDGAGTDTGNPADVLTSTDTSATDDGTGPVDTSVPVDACTPTCGVKECGDDGCNGVCGTCLDTQHCSTAGLCEVNCVPECTGKTCGDDGCGGSCGGCGAEQVCSVLTAACIPMQACGLLTSFGCCNLTWNHVCIDGHRESIDCATLAAPNATCGWSAAASLYKCGGEAEFDPSEQHWWTCPD